jgi:hypothetical protein
MLYQLRHYRVPSAHDLPALIQFAGEHLVPGLQAAGVQVIGCFTTSIGPQPRFSTLLAFPDPNAWQDQLDAFEASEAWRVMEPGLYPEGRALVTGYQTILLRQTSFSAEVTASLGASEPGVFEERIYYGMDPRAHARNLKRTGQGTSHVQRRAGMHLVAYWEIVAGAEQPAMYYLIRYASVADRMSQWAAFNADQERVRIISAATAGGPIIRHTESSFLLPTTYSPLR